jgi:hypothetical protein
MGPPGPQGPQGPAGGGGGASATTVEKDLGSTPVFRGTFSITDAAISGTSKVLVWQAQGPYTGKGTQASDAEMDRVEIAYVQPAAGSALVGWQTPATYFEIPYALQPGDQGRPNSVIGAGAQRREHEMVQRARRGRVRGNIKFHYVVFA